MLCRLVIAAALTFTTQCIAAPSGERWIATSTSSISITGNVILETSRIVFAAGKSLPIERIRNLTMDDGMGHSVPASLYRVTVPADPALIRGNWLCGMGAATYIAIWHVRPIMPTDTEGRAFAVYFGAAEPAPTARGACATYFYEMQ